MIGVRDEMKRGALMQSGDRCLQERQLGQGVVGALQEQHGDGDGRQMRCAFDRGLAGVVQGEGEEDEAPYVRQRRQRLGLGRHAAAERAAAGEQR